jgi:tetratricopeptide (TPR) repeat protein
VNADDMHEYVSKMAVAGALLAEGRTVEALPVAREVSVVAERIWGTESPKLADALRLLNRCLPETEQVGLRERVLSDSEQVGHCERALRGAEAAFDPDHVNVVNALHHLGRALQKVVRLDDALATFRRALDISERALGEEDPMGFTRELLRCVGPLLVDMGRFEEAIPFLEREARIADAKPSDDMTRLVARRILGRALLHCRRNAEATQSLEVALEIAERRESGNTTLMTNLRALLTEARLPEA